LNNVFAIFPEKFKSPVSFWWITRRYRYRLLEKWNMITLVEIKCLILIAYDDRLYAPRTFASIWWQSIMVMNFLGDWRMF